jgi:hypothetical protein
MTLIELAFWVVAVVMAILISKILTTLIGIPHWLALCTSVITLVALFVLAKSCIVKRSRPPCENGVCGARDYKVVAAAKKLGIAERGLVFECRCGKRYLSIPGKFLAIGANGDTRKYRMQKHLCSPWIDDI